MSETSKLLLGNLPNSEALRAFLEALEGAGLGCTVILTDEQRFERIYTNESIARIYGVPREVLHEGHPLAQLPPDQLERLMALRWAVRRGDTTPPPMVATTIVRADGTAIPVELGLGYSSAGDVRLTFVFVKDTSAQTAMEAALRESELRFRRLAETSADSIVILSRDTFVYANPAALKLVGASSLEELEARHTPWDSLMPRSDGEATVPNGRMPASNVHGSAHVRRQVLNGVEVYFESSLSHVTLDGVPAIVAYTRDITDRVRLQGELMKRDRLASVGVLAAGIAHELNNPLTAVCMQAHKLRVDAERLGLVEEARQAVAQIDDAAQQMSAIISDLLFMSRPADRPQAHVDVAKILASSVSLLRAGLSAAPRIEVDIEGEIPPVRGYASKLGQVFMNLLRNAVQAVESKTDGVIRVTARAQEEALEICIADNGIGIPAELLSRATEPFFTTKAEGTGLGLWISQSLIADHGGTLTLESTFGEGTSVNVKLPA